jgi:cytochrome P450
LIEDDSFEGFNIPAGTSVMWNSWGLHMSSSEYEQPERFWPERFMNDDVDKPIKGHLAFGTGKLINPPLTVYHSQLTDRLD